ncbi:MAG: hypothetical protein H6753_02420 [Candidatus Omnitrophica bacterium]|nr:hypothetical protein [Candidatus Omnitrophota bacterium]
MFLSFAARRKFVFVKKIICCLIILTFLMSLPGPASAQLASLLPVPGTAVTISPVFIAPTLKGLNIHPENPFLFDFIVGRGDDKIQGPALKAESEKLVKFFLTAMTIPDKEAWVNLSPYEANRIIPDALGKTEMGKVMLEQDYLLKQLASSLTNPETDLGKKFWTNVRAKVQEQFGTTDIPMSTFNKVWIVPAKAEVAEKDGKVFITQNRLKVMLEEDLDAMQKTLAKSSVIANEVKQSVSNLSSPKASIGDPFTNNGFPLKDYGNDSKDKIAGSPAAADNDILKISSQVFRTTILPSIEKEINEGKNFAAVRQIYDAAILAVWYKSALKESLLGKIYADKSKVKGIETDAVGFKQDVYNQYVQAFKKGAYNMIKEDFDMNTAESVPTRYFSGGVVLPNVVQKGANGVAASAVNANDADVMVQMGEVNGQDSRTIANKVAAKSAASAVDEAKALVTNAFEREFTFLPADVKARLKDQIIGLIEKASGNQVDQLTYEGLVNAANANLNYAQQSNSNASREAIVFAENLKTTYEYQENAVRARVGLPAKTSTQRDSKEFSGDKISLRIEDGEINVGQEVRSGKFRGSFASTTNVGTIDRINRDEYGEVSSIDFSLRGNVAINDIVSLDIFVSSSALTQMIDQLEQAWAVYDKAQQLPAGDQARGSKIKSSEEELNKAIAALLGDSLNKALTAALKSGVLDIGIDIGWVRDLTSDIIAFKNPYLENQENRIDEAIKVFKNNRWNIVKALKAYDLKNSEPAASAVTAGEIIKLNSADALLAAIKNGTVAKDTRVREIKFVVDGAVQAYKLDNNKIDAITREFEPFVFGEATDEEKSVQNMLLDSEVIEFVSSEEVRLKHDLSDSNIETIKKFARNHSEGILNKLQQAQSNKTVRSISLTGISQEIPIENIVEITFVSSSAVKAEIINDYQVKITLRHGESVTVFMPGSREVRSISPMHVKGLDLFVAILSGEDDYRIMILDEKGQPVHTVGKADDQVIAAVEIALNSIKHRHQQEKLVKHILIDTPNYAIPRGQDNATDVAKRIVKHWASAASAVTIPADIIEKSGEQATLRYIATNAQGAQTKANWTQARFVTNDDKTLKSGIQGEWITPTKEDKKKRGVVEILKGREHIGRDAQGVIYMDLFTTPYVDKTQNLKDMDGVGLQDAVDVIQGLISQGEDLEAVRSQVKDALERIKSGSQLDSQQDLMVINIGTQMHDLWAQHSIDNAGVDGVDSYTQGLIGTKFSELEGWLQELDINFVDIVLDQVVSSSALTQMIDQLEQVWAVYDKAQRLPAGDQARGSKIKSSEEELNKAIAALLGDSLNKALTAALKSGVLDIGIDIGWVRDLTSDIIAFKNPYLENRENRIDEAIKVFKNNRWNIVKALKAYDSTINKIGEDVKAGATASSQVGGINFDPTLMNLQVKRDKNGVPLPVFQQDLPNINIEGLYPVIINIAPATMANFPLLSKAEEAQQKKAAFKDQLSPADRQKAIREEDILAQKS